jgi:hypothetical protein
VKIVTILDAQKLLGTMYDDFGFHPFEQRFGHWSRLAPAVLKTRVT